MKKKRIAIIGGGASGMVAALEAKAPDTVVELYEKGPRLGKKLLATGNGRCNFSHHGFSKKNFHGTHPNFVAEALRQFDEKETLDFFKNMGLAVTLDERNRYYPASLQAQAVLDLLRLSLKEKGVSLHTEAPVTAIEGASDGTFLMQGPFGKSRADALIVATGGEASPQLGGSGDGYRLLASLGHRLIKTAPGIVQLACDHRELKACTGMKRVVSLQMRTPKKRLAQDGGELLITAYGLSGPPVLQCAGACVRALAKKEKVQAVINFFPEEDKESLYAALRLRRDAHPQRRAKEFFVGLLPRLLAQQTLKKLAIKEESLLSDKELQGLAALLTAWQVAVKGPRSFKDAQVTLGGIDTADFDPATMASWLAPGLFACGEVLDVDGDCGGYNLQWAWSSGRLAGSAAKAYVLSEEVN